jgi:hypothetical protein
VIELFPQCNRLGDHRCQLVLHHFLYLPVHRRRHVTIGIHRYDAGRRPEHFLNNYWMDLHENSYAAPVLRIA